MDFHSYVLKKETCCCVEYHAELLVQMRSSCGQDLLRKCSR